MCKLLGYSGLSGADLKHYAKYVCYRTAEQIWWTLVPFMRESWILPTIGSRILYLGSRMSYNVSKDWNTYLKRVKASIVQLKLCTEKKRNKEKCCNSVNFIIKHYISYTAGNACICDKKVHPIWMKYMGVHHVIWCNVKSHTFYVTKYDKIITWKVLYIWTYLPPNDGVTSFRDQQPQHTACVYDQNLACHTLEAPRCTNTWPLGHKL